MGDITTGRFRVCPVDHVSRKACTDKEIIITAARYHY